MYNMPPRIMHSQLLSSWLNSYITMYDMHPSFLVSAPDFPAS